MSSHSTGIMPSHSSGVMPSVEVDSFMMKTVKGLKMHIKLMHLRTGKAKVFTHDYWKDTWGIPTLAERKAIVAARSGGNASTTSQDQSNPRIPSNDELENFNILELKEFLKARGVGQTGNKDTLLKVAKLYANRPVIAVPSDQIDSVNVSCSRT